MEVHNMSQKEQPNYYAIIPATVRYNTNLNSTEKLLYGKITALPIKMVIVLLKINILQIYTM